MNRRALLGALGAGAVAATAGCSALGRSDASEKWVEEVSVNNLHSEPHTVSVLLLQDGEPVYWESLAAEPFDEAANRAGGGQFAGLPTDPGSYVLYVRLDDQPRSAWKRFALADHEHECLGMHVTVGELHGSPSDPPELRLLVGDKCPAE